MEHIGNYKDQEFGKVKLLKLKGETAASWNYINDDLGSRGKVKNNGRCSQIVHRLYKTV